MKSKSRKGKALINVDDIIGKRLGKLTVTGYAGYFYDETKAGLKMRHLYWCVCDCGTTKKIRRSELKHDIVKSCGCLRERRGRRR